jgi:hypothetical protein
LYPWLRPPSIETAQTLPYRGASDTPPQALFSPPLPLLLLPAPFGEVGRQTFDGRGATNGTATLSANGNIQQVTVTGTYTVTPDCTGSMTLNVSPLGITAHADFVIDDDGIEIRTIGTDPGEVETRVYRKQYR